MGGRKNLTKKDEKQLFPPNLRRSISQVRIFSKPMAYNKAIFVVIESKIYTDSKNHKVVRNELSTDNSFTTVKS